GSHDGTVRLWDLATGRARATLRHTSTGGVNAVAFSADGATVASGSWETEKRQGAIRQRGLIRLWNATTGQERALLKKQLEHVMSLAFSPDGRLLAAGIRDGSVKLWD